MTHMAPSRFKRCRLSCYTAVSAVVAGLVLSVSLSKTPVAAVDLPPRGVDLVEDRTGDTMASIRAAMSVDFLEAALLEATFASNRKSSGCDKPGEEGCPWPVYSMTDAEGVVHTCTVHDDALHKNKKGGSGSSDRGKDRKRAVEVSKALDPLNGKCAVLHHEYWSYTWCHRGVVKQTHRNDDGTTTEIKLGEHTRTEVKRASVVADSDDFAQVEEQYEEDDGSWIVGALKRKMKERRERKQREKEQVREKDTARGYADGRDPYEGIYDFSQVSAIHDFYEGGDKCEETGENRNVRTSITCCASQLVGADAVATTPMAMLVSIREVSTCAYLVKVCSRLLCPSLADDSNKIGGSGDVGGGAMSAVGKGVTAGGALDVLDALEACFPARQESWWTYELCLSTGIRQYHASWGKTSGGDLVNVVTSEFSLGKFDRSTVLGTEEQLFRPGAEGAEGAIVLEFTGGTECDLTGVLRSTTVFLKCGTIEEVTQVVEDHTCHYRVVAVSPLLCRHPALMPKLAPVRTVKCVPERKRRVEKLTLSIF